MMMYCYKKPTFITSLKPYKDYVLELKLLISWFN